MKSKAGPEVKKKNFFMLNSAEHENLNAQTV